MSTGETRLMEPVLDLCPIGVLMLDEFGRVQALNQVLADLIGVEPDDLVGHGQDTLSAGRFGYLFQPQDCFQLQDRQQRGRWVRCVSQPLGEGGSKGWIRYYMDITETVHLRRERDRLTAQVKEMVSKDRLSGLMNRRSLFQILDSEVTRSRRYNNPLSIALIAIQGHLAQAGKLQLIELDEEGMHALTGMLKDQLRWADQVGRLEGQRLLVVLPETSEEAAATLARKLRDRLQELRLSDEDGKAIKLSVVSTVTQWRKGDDTRRLLQRVSDELESEPYAGRKS